MKKLYFNAVILLLAYPLAGHAQQGGQGNTTIFGGGQMTFFGDYNFNTGGSGVQPGIIGTVRSPAPYGILNFAGTANSYTGAGDANHVDGYVRKLGTAPFIFPVGDNGQYGPFAAAGDGTTGAYFHADPTTAITSDLGGGNYPALPAGGPFPATSMSGGAAAVSTVEYWDIDGASATPITLTWDAGSNIAALTNNTLTNLTILGWNGSSWTTIPSVVDITSVLGGTSNLNAGSITTTGSIVPDNYVAYTLGALATPLPVSMISFSVVKSKQDAALLRWETALSANNERYEIEHSAAGKDWTLIGKVQPEDGSSPGVSNRYTFTHTSPKRGTNLYRLKIIDRNGSSGYSPTRSLLFESNTRVNIYPNPASDYIMLQNMNEAGLIGVRLIAFDGKELLVDFSLASPKVSLSNIPPGNYLLKLFYRDGSTESYRISRK